MSEQPDELVAETPEQSPIHHEQVRTEGETAVDDALGTTDDPTD